MSLYEIARLLQPTNVGVAAILKVTAPPQGVSMAELTILSDRFQLGLVPVERAFGGPLPVPSVAHWKSNHFVAILDKQGESYHMFDPASNSSRWLTGTTLNRHMSGQFLAPAVRLPADWRQLTFAEAQSVYGTVVVTNAAKAKDLSEELCPKDEFQNEKKCPTCHNDDECRPGNNNPNDAGCDGCSVSPGGSGFAMPVWKVAEPYINLWIIDKPMFYTTSHDDLVGFTLAYKQRNTVKDTNIFGVGLNWECNWRTWLQPDAVYTNLMNMAVADGGGRVYDTSGDGWHVASDTQIAQAQQQIDQWVVTMEAMHANTYFHPTLLLAGGAVLYYRTDQVDSTGRTNHFVYETNNNVVQLTKMIDADNLTNIVRYQNSSFPACITEVENPYGRKCTLKYDNQGRLTNIVDMAGLSSSFYYDSQGLITNMVTPYGTNVFQATTNTYSGFDFGGDNIVNRSLLITEPNGGHQLYMYRQAASQLNSADSTPLIPESYPLPDTSPFANTLETNAISARDSFYWGRQQYAVLSSSFRSNPTNFNNLSTNDYNLARMKHWLYEGQTNQTTVGQTLGLLRTPSPDGVTPGELIWYDYAGKVSGLNYNDGTNSRPSLIARLLPDGTSQFVHIERNGWKRPAQFVSTYSTVGTNVYLRTNTVSYTTDGADVREVRGQANELLVAYGNYDNHQPGVITNALNEVTTITYNNTNHQVIRIQWPSGLTTTNSYYTNGSINFLKETKDLETTNSISFTYTTGLVKDFTDARGLTVTLNWDALERLTNAVFPNGTVKMAYNKLDLSSFTDRLTNTYNFTYNSIRQLTQTVDPLNRTNTYTYCDCGNLESITDPLNRTTSFFYDKAGRLTNAVYPGGFSLTNFYSLVGRLTNVTDNAGYNVTNWYSNQGLFTASSNTFGRVFSAVYDHKDRATNVVDASGVAINSTFDLLDRLSTRSWPDGGVEKLFYNARGLTNYTDQLTNITQYYYALGSRLTNLVHLNIDTNRFEYNAAGDLLRLYDGKNQLTSWGYDQYGRVTSKVNASNVTDFVYIYDASDRLTNRTDGLSRQTTYRYDAVGNLTNVVYPGFTNKFVYDALNRLTNLVDAVGATAFTYNTNGLLGAEDGPWASDTVSYGYNAGRLRSSLSLSQPIGSWTQNYYYDDARRLWTNTSPAGTFVYAYSSGVGGLTSASDLIKKLSLPNGSYITNTFDSAARLTGTYLKNSGNTVLNWQSYAYYLDGTRSSQSRSGSYVNYTYNKLGQLRTASGHEDSTDMYRWHEQFSYGYDAAGNLNYRTNNDLVVTFNVNNLNQLSNVTRTAAMTVAGNASSGATNVSVNSANAVLYADKTYARTNVSLANGNNTFTAIATDSNGRTDTNSVTLNLPTPVSFQYDAKGNLTSDSRRGLEYDDENQLTRITVTNVWKSEFSYDGLFRRRIRKEYTWNGSWVLTKEIHYVYDGRVVLQERDGSNNPVVTYTRGVDLSGTRQGAGGIGGLLARTDANSAFYHADGNGNITAMIDGNQNVVAKYSYDPFGNTLAASGTLADVNTYRFSSQEYHSNSGLLLYLYRAYDPNLRGQ